MRTGFGVLTALLAGVFGATAGNVWGQPGAAAEVVSSSAGDVRVERLATLKYPWGMALLPDGRLLVTEKPGRLRIWSEGKLSEPVEGVPKVDYAGPEDQGGLLDVAVDSGFGRNGLVYVSYSESADSRSPGVDRSESVVRGGAVARGRLEGNALRDVEVIWRQEPKTVGRGHFGNRLVFAEDGTVFITSGERMRFDPAQSLESNLGKVVRINPDGSIPQGNPFSGREGARPDIWSYGHRNILAAAFEPGSGRLWAVEMGPRGGDELNLIEPGKNYGWPVVSDGDNYDGSPIPDHSTRPEFEKPVHTWTPVISPSGAVFYSGELFPRWRGKMLVGGLSSRALILLTLEGGRLAGEERIDMGRRIRDVLEMPDGALLLLVDDDDGSLLRLTPVATDRRE